MLPSYLLLGVIIVIILLIVQSLLKKTVESFASSDYSNYANYPLIYLGSNPGYGYREYWNYAYPYDLDNQHARFKNIIKRFGNPMYYTLFQVPEKQYQYSLINKYLEQLN